MPSSDYTSTVPGSLKLKGGGISKPRKKSKTKSARKTKPDTTLEPPRSESTNDAPEQEAGALQRLLAEEDAKTAEPSSERRDTQLNRPERSDGKTETQRRHEEMRRKRLDERLKKEGVKTHKERVEALNKYLSGLSEHHDMPRIGPG